ncbi:putative DNA primase/helicase [Rhodoblastus acidophilus]|uniref:phage/plasmid primase, P4 family n=1 Tax=Rhodoblastus acidophilus TaxID=1074 RepID=UPI0022258C7C|nr:phage/plasmid primase, P4 family [Rhodoblastus acidophilus]MCW2317629.1 putative DNA primase/helicase [Rhodoblastus acidophilus]
MEVVPFPGAQSAPQIVTEDSAALEFAERHKDVLRFDHSAGSWFRFDGASWLRDATGVAFEWARQQARTMSAGERDNRVRYAISRTSFARGVERFAQHDQRLATTADVWDRDPWLLGTPGGTIDLRNGALREPDPADMITKVTAVAPEAADNCPRWKQFLAESCGGDAALIAFLQRFVGYALTGLTTEHSLVFLVGPGGNGKSVFLSVLRGILGDYARVAAMDSFVASYGDRHPADIAALNGARLVVASETEEGRAWDETRLKALTGGDAVSARFMRGNFFTFTPKFKLLFIGNDKPSLRTVNDAMRRRLHIVEFGHKPERPDLRLEEKLRAEWPAILRWALNGCRKWQMFGLRPPPCVVAASEAYFRDQDVLSRFLDEECIFEVGNDLMRTAAADLWAAWTQYARDNLKPPGRLNEFASALEKRGARKFRTNAVRGFVGIALKGGS